MAPYKQSGKLKTFSGEVQFTAGIRSIAAPGHTPGHIAYLVESEGHKLLLWGDIVHVPAVQFCAPAVTIAWDSDQLQAKQTRESLFVELASDGELAGGAHIYFPELGKLRKQDDGYVWVPLTRRNAK